MNFQDIITSLYNTIPILKIEDGYINLSFDISGEIWTSNVEKISEHVGKISEEIYHTMIRMLFMQDVYDVECESSITLNPTSYQILSEFKVPYNDDTAQKFSSV